MDIQHRAVSGKSCMEAGSYTRCQLTAYRRCPHENRCRFHLLDEMFKHLGIGFNIKPAQTFLIADKNLICAIVTQFFGRTANIMPHKQRINLLMNLVGKFAGLAQ